MQATAKLIGTFRKPCLCQTSSQQSSTKTSLNISMMVVQFWTALALDSWKEWPGILVASIICAILLWIQQHSVSVMQNASGPIFESVDHIKFLEIVNNPLKIVKSRIRAWAYLFNGPSIIREAFDKVSVAHPPPGDNHKLVKKVRWQIFRDSCSG